LCEIIYILSSLIYFSTLTMNLIVWHFQQTKVPCFAVSYIEYKGTGIHFIYLFVVYNITY